MCESLPGKAVLRTVIRGIPLEFEASAGLFSPRGVDAGTLAMLSDVEFRADDRVLDLGCGWGAVGILAAKLIGAERVVMSDVDPAAVACAAENARRNGVGGVKIRRSDGFRELDDRDFSLILSNPPYHADFSVPKEFIEKGFNRLRLGGRLYMVTKRRDWYKNKLISIFGGVQIRQQDGYFVFMAEKKSPEYARGKPMRKKG